MTSSLLLFLYCKFDTALTGGGGGMGATINVLGFLKFETFTVEEIEAICQSCSELKGPIHVCLLCLFYLISKSEHHEQ